MSRLEGLWYESLGRIRIDIHKDFIHIGIRKDFYSDRQGNRHPKYLNVERVRTKSQQRPSQFHNCGTNRAEFFD